jgi:lysophospholipase L1-like esterase
MKLQFSRSSLPHRRLLVSAVTFIATGALLTIPAQALEASTSASADASELLVGIGDSYTAGVGVTPYEPASVSTGCNRSLSGAYPTLAAEQLDIETANYACSGATTAAFDSSFKAEPAQTAQVADATVVVMTIGGNDVGALSALASGDVSELAGALQALPAKLGSAYASVKAAAPQAGIYAVTYPDILPTSSSSLEGCVPDELQDLDLTQLHAAVTALNTAITLSAKRAGIEVIDAGDAVAGHELCSEDPWVIGLGSSAALHPNSEGHQAMADLVAQELADSVGGGSTTTTTKKSTTSSAKPSATSTTRKATTSTTNDACGCTTTTEKSTTTKKSTTSSTPKPTTSSTKRSTTSSSTSTTPSTTSSTFITPATIPVTSRKPTTTSSTTTSTTEPEVAPEEASSEEASTTTSSTTEPEVAPSEVDEQSTTTTEQPAEVRSNTLERGEQLAETGAEVTRVFSIGVLLLGVGLGLIWIRKIVRERSDRI